MIFAAGDSVRPAAGGDVVVGVLTRPQSSVADFYRELGHLFGVKLSPHNRYAGAKVLRETWLDHIESSTYRAVLLIDEAQEMRPSVLSELRLLSSMHLDSRALLTVVLAGDQRLTDSFRTPELLPIASRIRSRLQLGYAHEKTLRATLDHLLEQAGNSALMTDALCQFEERSRQQTDALIEHNVNTAARVEDAMSKLVEVLQSSDRKGVTDEAEIARGLEHLQSALHEAFPSTADATAELPAQSGGDAYAGDERRSPDSPMRASNPQYADDDDLLDDEQLMEENTEVSVPERAVEGA